MKYSHLTILIVEDNRINQLLLKNTLLKFGFTNFSVAESGEAALKKHAEKNFDLILLDIQMPGMDGYEITNAIRTTMSPEYLTVPIIALTANGSKKDKAKALEAGVNEYVIKPYTPEDLYSTILKYVDASGKKATTGKKKNKRAEKEKTTDKNKRAGIDLGFLEKYTDGDEKILRQLIEIFLREVPDTIKKLEQFIKEANWKEVHAAAHKVKSSFAIFELFDLRKIALEMEECSSELIHVEKIPKLFEAFNSGCVKALLDLEAELKKLNESENQ